MVAALVLVFALGSSVPNIGLQQTCRGAQQGALPEDRANAFQSCLHDEQTARSQLTRVWNRIPADIRQSCTDEATGISPSYVELLTCLEMRTGGKFSGAEGLGGTPEGSTTAPAVTPAPGGSSTPPAPTPLPGVKAPAPK
jgi:hypothetical protein